MLIVSPQEPDTVETLAGRAAAILQEALGLDLAFDSDSVLRLDQWISEHHHSIAPRDRDDLAAVIGAFVGECMRRELGGVWEWSRDDWGIRLESAPEIRDRISSQVVYPLRKARRHLEEGPSQSIASFYQLASGLCEPNLGRDDPRHEVVRSFLEQLDRTIEARRNRSDIGSMPVKVTLPPARGETQSKDPQGGSDV